MDWVRHSEYLSLKMEKLMREIPLKSIRRSKSEWMRTAVDGILALKREEKILCEHSEEKKDETVEGE